MSLKVRRSLAVALATLGVATTASCVSTLPTRPSTRVAGAESTRSPSTPAATDSIWYITNRARNKRGWEDARASVSHGVRSFALRPLRSDSVHFEVRLDVQVAADTVLNADTFHRGLARSIAAMRDSTDGVLLHVHGYSTPLHDAASEAAEMHARGGSRGPMVIFSWPASATGFTWPTRRHVFTQAYWQDSVTAIQSAPDLALVLQDVIRTVGAHRLVVSSHSMGAQLLAAALQDSALRRTLSETPLRAIAFVSPDVDRQQFLHDVLPRVQPLTKRVALYAARNDVLLRISGVLHDGKPRAGALGDSAVWPASLEVVDITDGRRAAFWTGPWIDTNHAIRRQGSALVDLFSMLVGNAPAHCRAHLGTSRDTRSGVWKLTAAPLPERALFSVSVPTPASLHTLPQCA